MDYFYDALQKAIDITQKCDIVYVIGDWNAKVGKQNTAGVTGSFGLGIKNEIGDTMVDFCSRNNLVVMNVQTTCKKNVYLLYVIDYCVYYYYFICVDCHPHLST